MNWVLVVGIVAILAFAIDKANDKHAALEKRVEHLEKKATR